MKIELEVSEANEATEAPWWILIDPSQIRQILECVAEHGEIIDDDRIREVIAHSIEGPFFSRKEGEEYLISRRYAYGESADIWCASGYRAHQYLNAIRVARKK